MLPDWLKFTSYPTTIERFHITSCGHAYWCSKTMKRQPCWCLKPILWELNSVCMYNAFFCSNKFAHADAGHVSENALQYKGKMVTLSTELTSASVHLRKKLTPLHFLHDGANSPRACSDFLKRRSRIISDCLAFRLGSVTSRCSKMSPRSPPPHPPEQKAGRMSLLLSNLTWIRYMLSVNIYIKI